MNRIVVIEDDPAILRGLADNLRYESFDVITASDGESGYRLVRESEPDMVILDLMLPGMNGYDICREMRSHGLATPILMLTALDGERDRVAGFDSGVDDFVTKPFSIRELVGRVRAILRRSEGRLDIRSQQELNDTRRIQERLMPAKIPQIPGFRIGGSSRPAGIVGGDYFDVLPLGGNAMAICIADVCGKGVAAAMTMANLQGCVKTCAAKRMRPAELCEATNQVMCGNMASHGFISFFYAIIESVPRRLTYCNAGHNPPILISPSLGPESFRRLDMGGGILGVLPEWNYVDQEVPLHSGDRILMYTDGITECRDSSGEEFGEDRLIEFIFREQKTDADTLTAKTIREANRFSSGRLEDDVTVVAVTVD
jgi:two-component system, sensor histidine kinase ChiS